MIGLVQGVGPGPDPNEMPHYAYSIGLSNFNLPEIMIVGYISFEISAQLINIAGETMRQNGSFKNWACVEFIIKNYPVYFRKLTDESIDKPDVLQMFLPDKKGLFPWDIDCSMNLQVKINDYIVGS